MLKVIHDAGETITLEHIKIVFNQIVWTSLNRYPNGSLDYNFKFPNKASQKDLIKWVDGNENINAIIRNEFEEEMVGKFSWMG